jgi:hypothetical protein
MKTYEILNFVKPSTEQSIPVQRLEIEQRITVEMDNSSVYMKYKSKDRPIVPLDVRSSQMANIPFFNEIETTAFNDNGYLTGENILVHYLLARVEDNCILVMNYNEAKYPAIKLLVNTETAQGILNHNTENDGFINKKHVNLETCKDIKLYLTNNRSLTFEVMAHIFNQSALSLSFEDLLKIPKDVEISEQQLIDFKAMPFSITVNESPIHVIEKFGNSYVLYSYVLETFQNEIKEFFESKNI